MKVSTHYSCTQCGFQSAKWLGKCPDCGAWNSLTEEITEKGGDKKRPSLSKEGPVAINSLTIVREPRTSTGIAEFDRVLGGGVVNGSIILIGGDPGIGKSTILLQVMNRLAGLKTPVLYVSGEESTHQIRLRGSRMGIDSEFLYLLPETSLEQILIKSKSVSPSFIVIDSIQTVYTSALESAPGSVSQVRETAGRLMLHAKSSNIPIFLVGHVTKEGALAGPRVLEHLVDTVLYFEGDTSHSYRILRTVKNRFGSTNEIGVFEMREDGLSEVTNPSELFLAERPEGVAGSVVTASMEGSRPLLVEIQALVCQTQYGVPRRTTIGVDHNRVALLVAVLEKKGGLHLAGADIFINVAGGVKLNEPAIDLALVCSLASSHLDKPIPSDTIVIGEVGLAGEVRGVSRCEQRVNEAEKLGFCRCILPLSSASKIRKSNMKIEGVSTVSEALELLL